MSHGVRVSSSELFSVHIKFSLSCNMFHISLLEINVWYVVWQSLASVVPGLEPSGIDLLGVSLQY